jgi:nucleoside-diphosphate-sugar epimerase
MGRFDFCDLLKLNEIDFLRICRTCEKQRENEHETANLNHGKPPPEFGYCTPHPLRIIKMRSTLSRREREVFMNVLILGGTRFVGKRLVHLLADQGHDVTVGSRGKTIVSFPDNVRRLKLDRASRDSMATALQNSPWDIVYDQICFDADDAACAVEVLAGKTSRYVLCSSAAVYTNPLDAGEDAFDPSKYSIRSVDRSSTAYAEGKRQAEAVIFQRASFPAVAVRFPIILGPDDYTKRLRMQVQRIANNEPINIENPEAEISLISSTEASAFLAWLSGVSHTGPFNACSDGPVSLKTIIGFIEEATSKTAIVNRQPDTDSFSIFGKPVTATINTGKARQCGFQFQLTRDWLQALVRNAAT